jgi:hypothetical protein
MGFWSSLKKIFSLSGEDEAELAKLREKHGINTAPEEATIKEIKNEPNAKDYDVWEDLRNYRSTFWMGSWATKQFKFRPVGEEKVKQQLEALARKREEEEARKRGEGGTGNQ